MEKAELITELRTKIAALSDLGDDDLAWLVDQGEVIDLEAGQVAFEEGQEADAMYMYLSGEMQVRRRDSGMAAIYIAREGTIGGVLPYSRMTKFIGHGFAVTPTRMFRIPRTSFDALLQRIPILAGRLVNMMTDRVRESTKIDVQRDKLMALGKMSAGLAHELNNPASAARRAAETLKSTLLALRETRIRVEARELTREQRQLIIEMEGIAINASSAIRTMDALTRSDLEESLGTWLSDRGVPDAWRVTPALVDAGVTVEGLGPLAESIGPEALGDVLSRVAGAVTVQRLAEEIENATKRIADLVRSIKEYSYMDQAPVQEVDIHTGIESTLVILGHKLKTKSVNLERHFAEGLPRVCAYGSELNQVWTNLIDNAIDAIASGGHIELRTTAVRDGVCVEVIDDGTGIPPEVRAHIFEPFFTTKPVGEGTGLGLETVYRIVQKHRGEIRVDSEPGRTVFSVKLPLDLTTLN